MDFMVWYVLAILWVAFFSVSVHALLIHYGVTSWRRLQPQHSFRSQLPQLLRRIPAYLLAWIVLAGVMYVPAPILIIGGVTPELQWFLVIIVVIPMSPVLVAIFFLWSSLTMLSFAGIDFQPEWYISVPVIAAGTLLSAVLILLLISFVEWLVLRAGYRRSTS